MGYHSTLEDHPEIVRVLKDNGYKKEEIAFMVTCGYLRNKVKNRMGQVEDDGLRLRVFSSEGICDLRRSSIRITHGSRG